MKDMAHQTMWRHPHFATLWIQSFEGRPLSPTSGWTQFFRGKFLIFHCVHFSHANNMETQNAVGTRRDTLQLDTCRVYGFSSPLKLLRSAINLFYSLSPWCFLFRTFYFDFVTLFHRTAQHNNVTSHRVPIHSSKNAACCLPKSANRFLSCCIRMQEMQL